MRKAYKVFKIISLTFLIIFIAILLVYNAYLIIARLIFKNNMPTILGYSFAAVISGSMADEIEVGDFIVTKAQDEYFVGDIITYYDSQSLTYITHRIIFVSDGIYETKGDANDVADNLKVPYSAVVGKVVAVWDGAGKIVSFFQSPSGLLCVLFATSGLWAMTRMVKEVYKKEND